MISLRCWLSTPGSTSERLCPRVDRETVTNWRDIATSHSVKEVLTIVVSGTLPTTGYAVSREILLDSITP